jgi:hypothetical protein
VSSNPSFWFDILKRMDIFEKIRELNLPEGSYVIVGGGTLVALGLLEWDADIDMSVTPEIFARLQAEGWQQGDWGGKTVLRHDIYDIGIGFGKWSLKDLQADSMNINGIPFISIEKLLQWKREAARPKDLRHVELIEHYLHDHTTTKGVVDKSPAQQIDDILKMHADWRGTMLSRLRAVIKQTDLTSIEEQVKWKKPSKPEGVPVWSYEGIICVGETLKNAVRLTFPKGAKLQDPSKLFNTRLDSKSVRAIDFHEGDSLDEAALKSLILNAMKLNTAKAK